MNEDELIADELNLLNEELWRKKVRQGNTNTTAALSTDAEYLNAQFVDQIFQGFTSIRSAMQSLQNNLKQTILARGALNEKEMHQLEALKFNVEYFSGFASKDLLYFLEVAHEASKGRDGHGLLGVANKLVLSASHLLRKQGQDLAPYTPPHYNHQSVDISGFDTMEEDANPSLKSKIGPDETPKRRNFYTSFPTDSLGNYEADPLPEIPALVPQVAGPAKSSLTHPLSAVVNGTDDVGQITNHTYPGRVKRSMTHPPITIATGIGRVGQNIDCDNTSYVGSFFPRDDDKNFSPHGNLFRYDSVADIPRVGPPEPDYWPMAPLPFEENDAHGDGWQSPEISPIRAHAWSMSNNDSDGASSTSSLLDNITANHSDAFGSDEHLDDATVSKVQECVEALKFLGYGSYPESGFEEDRIVVYAQAANGSLDAALDMIEEDQSTWDRRMKEESEARIDRAPSEVSDLYD